MKTLHSFKQNRKSEKGFTLVELAIVMIIIGLLIGGVLQGQQLIQSAQITNAVSQLRSLDVAFQSFRDAYNGLPGDLANSGARLPGCTDACAAVVGAGDNQITPAAGGPGVAVADVDNEISRVWMHLTAADLVNFGITISPTAGAATALGTTMPQLDIGNSGLKIAFTTTGALVSDTDGTDQARGHYALLDASVAAAPANDGSTGSLTPNQAARIDAKLDDGLPNTGNIVGAGGVGAGGANCADADTNAGVYNEAQTTTNCGIYMRLGI